MRHFCAAFACARAVLRACKSRCASTALSGPVCAAPPRPPRAQSTRSELAKSCGGVLAVASNCVGVRPCDSDPQHALHQVGVAHAAAPSLFAFHFNSARASACKTLASRENEACGVQEYTRGSDAIHYVRNGSRDLCDLFYAHNRPRPRASHITTITASSITTMTRFVILVAVATAHEISSTPARARVRIPRIN